MNIEGRYHKMIWPDKDGQRFMVAPPALANGGHIVQRHFESYREAFVYAMGFVDALENALPALRVVGEEDGRD